MKSKPWKGLPGRVRGGICRASLPTTAIRTVMAWERERVELSSVEPNSPSGKCSRSSARCTDIAPRSPPLCLPPSSDPSRVTGTAILLPTLRTPTGGCWAPATPESRLQGAVLPALSRSDSLQRALEWVDFASIPGSLRGIFEWKRSVALKSLISILKLQFLIKKYTVIYFIYGTEYFIMIYEWWDEIF